VRGVSRLKQVAGAVEQFCAPRSQRDRTVLVRALGCVVVAGLVVTATAWGAGDSVTNPSAAAVGAEVPPEQLDAINLAAESCPTLSPARLAAQVMTASAFHPAAQAVGVDQDEAGLSQTAWKRWAPRPNAQRSNSTDDTIALAHEMCDLVGQTRAAGVPGDLWQLALAAHHSGLGAVIAANGIPSDASGYVNLVTQYATSYSQRSELADSGTSSVAPTGAPPTSSPAGTTSGAPRVAPNSGANPLAAQPVAPQAPAGLAPAPQAPAPQQPTTSRNGGTTTRPAPSPTNNGVAIDGQVTCTSHSQVVGVWIATGSGSGWASWRPMGDGSAAYYLYKLPYWENYSLHVGCGGSPQHWKASINSPSTSPGRHAFDCDDVANDPHYGTCTMR
jgi:hypothetical protein